MILKNIDIDDLLYFAARCNLERKNNSPIMQNNDMRDRFNDALESYVLGRLEEKELANKIKEEYENGTK